MERPHLTVATLIAELQRLPPDLPIAMEQCCDDDQHVYAAGVTNEYVGGPAVRLSYSKRYADRG